MKKFAALLLALMLALTMMSFASADEAGKVFYLNFKPEADQAWQDLAAKYTELTGVEVKVQTAASGTYDSTLTSAMDKKDAAPTLFQVGNQTALNTWDYTLLDLGGSDLVNEMTSADFVLKNAEGQIKAVGFVIESYGIITNKALLEQAGYKIEDIKDFASLKAIADDIHARAEELGFDAFTSAGLDGSSSWRFSGHLTNMPLFYESRDDAWADKPATVKGTYMDAYKNIWDLYVADSAADPAKLADYTGDQAEAEFGTGKAVFYQNGTWEWSSLTGEKFGMNPDDIVMIPIYCGVEGEDQAGLCTGSENYWCVNSAVSEADQKATLDFLKWVVTSDEGTSMMAKELGTIPFKAAKESDNGFIQDANDLLAAGKYPVTWAFTLTPNVDDWRAGIVSALTQYSAGLGGWDAVVSEFVDGWATQYALENDD